MSSSPKLFQSRQPLIYQFHRSFISVCCIVFGLSGFVLGFLAISRHTSGYKCRDFEPKSVSVKWEYQNRNSIEHSVDFAYKNGEGSKRYRVMGFVGIQTGFSSAGRRKVLRQTWMPSTRQGLKRLEETTGLAFRFVIGQTNNPSKMSELKKEVAEYDDFLLLDIEEAYKKLPYKTLAFFKAAYGLFDSEFYVKADDDIYLRPDRLSLLLAKKRTHLLTYLGCMKKGPVFTDPNLKWYEPLHYLLGKEYFFHAYGPIYALSADVVSNLIALRNNSFRMFSNEDVTIGVWMLAMNVNHENDRELCASACTSSSIAVWDIPRCSGLCNPEEKLLDLHQMEICSGISTLVS